MNPGTIDTIIAMLDSFQASAKLDDRFTTQQEEQIKKGLEAMKPKPPETVAEFRDAIDASLDADPKVTQTDKEAVRAILEEAGQNGGDGSIESLVEIMLEDDD